MEFFEGFLDDYFAECDEHLIGARRALLSLEAALAKPGSEHGTVEELFRIYHSLKGISGMVELRAAEELAHELESYLRALRQRDTLLTAQGIDALADGTQRLEQVIVARRASTSEPPIDDIVGRLAELVPAIGKAQPGPGHAPSREQSPDLRSWRIVFRPSRELLARGVGVDAVRKQLAELGQIVSATPHVGSGGTIEFEFVVATDAAEPALRPLRDIGVTYEPATPVPPASEAGAAADVRSPGASFEGDALSGAVAPSHYVRVDLTRLDDLMRGIGDLVISRARLADSLGRVERHVPAVEWRLVQENAVAIDRQLRSLREGIMRIRLVPVGEIFRRMPFVVRDLARTMEKRVNLQLLGQGTEIDKYVIERMMDPVLHLVRNAVSHGIEMPAERAAAGKPLDGTITLAAATVGDMVTIEIADDGRGIDAEAVAARARSAGLAVPHGQLDEPALLNLICAPGLSTREESDRAAGRGVGMAVVKSTVDQLSGSIALETRPGSGTRFTIALPITLAITDALIAQVGEQTFAIPQGAIREVLAVAEREVRAIEQSEVIPHRESALPIVRLGRLFGIEPRARDSFHVFVTGHGVTAVGLAVDRIVGQREIVVRAITDPLVKVDGIAGATDLGDGRVVLILDPAAVGRIPQQRASVGGARRAFARLAGIA